MDFNVLVADFGESKRLGDGDQILTSSSCKMACAIGDYMPKEVGEEGGWSSKVDVFCIGRIAEMMLRTRITMCTSEGSKEEKAIPATLKKVMMQCLAEKAAERPEMLTVCRDLDDLWSQIDDGEAKWTTIEFSRPPPTSTTSWSSLQFSA
jgi:hypothetical protein